jgi:ATP synthase protein I
MQEEPRPSRDRRQQELSRSIGRKEARRERARRRREHSVWFGLGVFGVVGWSVAIPTLLAILLGTWIDRTFPSQYSWTLTMVFIGIVAGCLNAWYWLSRERSLIERERQDDP